MISVDAARWIIYYLDAGELARLTYRAAVAARDYFEGNFEVDFGSMGAPFRVAAVVLDLRDGEVDIVCFHGWHKMDVPHHLIVLAIGDTEMAEDAEREVGEGCVLPPSREQVEEHVARGARRVGISERAVHMQLRLAYEIKERWDDAMANVGEDEFAGQLEGHLDYFEPFEYESGEETP